MDPRIRTKIETQLEEIALELNSPEMSATLAEVLYDERDTLLRMLAEDDDAWNHLEFQDPEDGPSWPPPLEEGRVDRDGELVVTLPCTECGLVDETTAGMDGRCADCFCRSCEACGSHGPLTLGRGLLCELCRDVEAEEDTRGCGNCAGCAYCMGSADFVPGDEV